MARNQVFRDFDRKTAKNPSFMQDYMPFMQLQNQNELDLFFPNVMQIVRFGQKWSYFYPYILIFARIKNNREWKS
ncbi:MAG: hypothetical protein MJZ06_09385 [Bacteroidaceae bacterium]|nr:hypothetical protein [Bacteroidaceae bacterium]